MYACRLLGELSNIQQQLIQPVQDGPCLSDQVDRLVIRFVIATVQVETAAQLLQVRTIAKTSALAIVDAALLPQQTLPLVSLHFVLT